MNESSQDSIADLDRLIDAILDGDEPAERLGEADAPGESWRELAMLRHTTEQFREDLDVPDQTSEILVRVHAKRGFASRRTRGRVSAVRGSLAAGLMVTLGLFAFAEHTGLGVSIRGDSEPVTRLTASTTNDVERVTTAVRETLRTWVAAPQAEDNVETELAYGRMELAPRVSGQWAASQSGEPSEAELRAKLAAIKGGLQAPAQARYLTAVAAGPNQPMPLNIQITITRRDAASLPQPEARAFRTDSVGIGASFASPGFVSMGRFPVPDPWALESSRNVQRFEWTPAAPEPARFPTDLPR